MMMLGLVLRVDCLNVSDKENKSFAQKITQIYSLFLNLQINAL